VSAYSLQGLLSLSGLELLSKSLVSKHLLPLEDFLGKSDLQLNQCLLINQATLRFTVIDKELLVIYKNGLSLFNIATQEY
jgi:hypothetical protein